MVPQRSGHPWPVKLAREHLLASCGEVDRDSSNQSHGSVSYAARFSPRLHCRHLPDEVRGLLSVAPFFRSVMELIMYVRALDVNKISGLCR